MNASILPHAAFWHSAGEYPDIHIASVMRMRRNIAHMPFRAKMQACDGKTILDSILDNKNWIFPCKTGRIDTGMNEQDLLFFNEESLGLPDGEPRFDALISDEAGNCIAVNGHAHVNLYHLMPDTAYFAGFNKLDELDDRVNEAVTYAFLPSTGYLFEDPSECGSGFAVKALLHLPVLSLSSPPDDIASICYDYDVQMIQLDKHIQLSAVILSTKPNTVDSEQDICANMASAIAACAKAERHARDEYYEKYRNQIDDAVWRSYGLLRHCRMIQWKEAAEYLLNLRFGAVMSVIKDVPLQNIHRLFFETMNAHILRRCTADVSADECSVRAALIRSTLEKE